MQHYPLRIVIFGLTITSSWGNGHATTYRGLARGLSAQGHDVLFLERDMPWYAIHRDLPQPPYGRTELYQSFEELIERFEEDVRHADLVIVGSSVPGGVAVGAWVTATAKGLTAFYDLETPTTLAKLDRGEHEYLSPALIPRYDLYLSFAGGAILGRLERDYNAQLARALYCACDPESYYPAHADTPEYALGYMGAYTEDRQPSLESLLLEPARRLPDARFVVAGPQYPAQIAWPENVTRIDHVAPADHCDFYNAQCFTLNLTRAEMRLSGYAPSVRLFEAAACGTAIISDDWAGLDAFFKPNDEILVARSPEDILRALTLHEEIRTAIAERARRRLLAEHTSAHRVETLMGYIAEAQGRRTALYQAPLAVEQAC